MKPMLKQAFSELAIRYLKTGCCPRLVEEGYSMFLGYTDIETGDAVKVAIVAKPKHWDARVTMWSRFNKWLTEIATSAEHGAMWSANQSRATTAIAIKCDTIRRRAREKAENASNAINNILKDLEGFDAPMASASFFRTLTDSLVTAKVAAEKIKER